MSLSVIGTGFGRTGTMSLKLALERLGFGPCYHMYEVFANPEHIDVWNNAADGKAIDWEMLFTGYNAAVDFPAARFWRNHKDLGVLEKRAIMRPCNLEYIWTTTRRGSPRSASAAPTDLGRKPIDD